MGNSSNAQTHGDYVYQYPGTVSSSDKDDQIINIEIWACRLLHGSYSWAATFGANTLTLGSNDSLEHWWLRIETKYYYYTIQKWGDGKVSMRRVNSGWEANQCGLACADKQTDADRWIKQSCSISSQYKTIGWFTEMLSNMRIGGYNFLQCNCQDFAYRAYETIRNGTQCNSTRGGNYAWLHPATGIAFLVGNGKIAGSKRL